MKKRLLLFLVIVLLSTTLFADDVIMAVDEDLKIFDKFLKENYSDSGSQEQKKLKAIISNEYSDLKKQISEEEKKKRKQQRNKKTGLNSSGVQNSNDSSSSELGSDNNDYGHNYRYQNRYRKGWDTN